MPNWCFNNVMIRDENPETIHLIKNQLNRPFERTFTTYWDRETNSFIPKTLKFSNPVFSFWNIKAPTDLEAYEKQSDFNPADPYGGDDWYSFNNREWGTKWDVAISDDNDYPETDMTYFKADGQDNCLGYRFDTAWGPPTEAMIHLSNQYPTAIITLSWEEEQGFGGEFEFVAGEITSESSYESRCRDCDEYDCMEWCDECVTNICDKCHYMGEADLEGAKECPTHKLYLDNIPDYRKENA